jgi:hypothetical protein
LPYWTLSDAPVVSIGGPNVSEEYILEEITGIVVLSDGRIAVSDGVGQQIRVYSEGGDHIADWGREGSGPGEYRYLRRLVSYRGDSIAAFDMVQRRITILGEDGTLGRMVRQPIGMVRTPGSMASQSCCQLGGVFSDGSFLVEMAELVPLGATGTVWSSLTFVRLAPDGASADTIATLQASEYRLADPRGTFEPLRLAPSFSYWVVGDGFIYGNGATDQLSKSSPNGTPLWQRSTGLARREVTSEVRERTQAFFQSLRNEAESSAQEVELLFPDKLPAYDRVIVDADNHVWLRRPTYWGARENEYMVLSASGEAVARIEVPGALWIMQVERDHVWGIERDDLGVQYVRGYRLSRQQ